MYACTYVHTTIQMNICCVRECMGNILMGNILIVLEDRETTKQAVRVRVYTAI
jgi:hypothetical protein